MSKKNNQVIDELNVRVTKLGIPKKDVQKVFSSHYAAVYKDPEWVTLNDLGCHENKLPLSYSQALSDDDKELNRTTILPSVLFGYFGEFLDSEFNLVKLAGIVYTYCQTNNPRKIQYAYKLFANDKQIAKNAALGGRYEAEMECTQSAKEFLQRCYSIE